jgi:hypothetical protein
MVRNSGAFLARIKPTTPTIPQAITISHRNRTTVAATRSGIPREAGWLDKTEW